MVVGEYVLHISLWRGEAKQALTEADVPDFYRKRLHLYQEMCSKQ